MADHAPRGEAVRREETGSSDARPERDGEISEATFANPREAVRREAAGMVNQLTQVEAEVAALRAQLATVQAERDEAIEARRQLGKLLQSDTQKLHDSATRAEHAEAAREALKQALLKLDRRWRTEALTLKGAGSPTLWEQGECYSCCVADLASLAALLGPSDPPRETR